MRTKGMALVLTLTFTGSLLAGCSGSSDGEQGVNSANASNVNETGMPIVKEPVNLTFFTGKSPTNGNKFEDVMVWKEYAKMTNVNVKFELVPFESLAEKKNLLLAGGDYPDGFYSARLSATELAKYGKEGVFIKLNDLIDQHAPNFKKLLEKYPDLKKGLTMPDGNIYSFPSFYDPSFLSMLIGTPLWVNKDWLAKLNMKEPATTEEYYQYLKAVKETDLNGNGQKDEIPYGGTGIGNLMNQLKGAWGLGNRGLGHPYVDIDPGTQKLRFIKTDPKFKELLQYMNKLHAEGLFDKEIFTIKDSALYARGQQGLYGSTVIPNPATLMNQKNYIGLGALQGPGGEQMYSHIKTPMVHTGAFAITNKNKNPEATVRWMDYFFSEEGAKFYFLGQKDVTYKETDGKIEYVPDITQNPQGLTQDQALAKYFTWLGGSYPGYVRGEYFKGSETLPEAMATAKKAEPHAIKEIWSSFSFTEEETEIMSSLGKDITTYITEMEAKFINGTVPFSEWDKYVATIQKMGLDSYMKTYQSAYDRYSTK
ncbi:extracellular solute-binding protein [Paenibacillus sp. FJAT-26967]|uniref:extracellular solute-binding protein n=1 Tax=Paenibacillus sp. FJAT-26967 TaxID=1729690 RepID=UPI000839B11C|nr:extracellular solute-binding protein [Paenibacillus sp. FJAT-26967]